MCARLGARPARCAALRSDSGGQQFDRRDRRSRPGETFGTPQFALSVRTSPGVAEGTNAGILSARSPIIAFTDDDIVVADDWVRSVYQAFQRYANADCVGGPVLPRWPSSGKPVWFSELQTSPLALQDKGQRPVFVNQHNAAPCLIGANFAFRKSAFAKSGLFDPQVHAHSGPRASASTLAGGRSRRIRARHRHLCRHPDGTTDEGVFRCGTGALAAFTRACGC